MVRPSVRDRKPVQGISYCTVSDAESSTRTVIGRLRFCDDFYLLHLIYDYIILFILLWKSVFLHKVTMQDFYQWKAIFKVIS